MRDKKIFAPTLYPLSRDVSREWFIRYKVKDYTEGVLKDKTYKGYLNLEPDYDRRLILAFNYLLDLRNDILPDDVRGARYIMPERPAKTFADTAKIFEDNLKGLLPTLEKPTQISYKSKNNIFKQWLILTGYNTLPIGQLDRRHIKEFSIWLRVERNYKAKSHNDVIGKLALIYDEILENIDELDTQNPFRQVKRMKGKSIGYEPHPREVRQEIAVHMPNEDVQLWIAIQFLFYHFIRIKELGRIKIGDIDFSRGTIYIRDNVNLKSGKSRVMAVRTSLMEYLIKQGYDKYDANCYLLGNKGVPGLIAVSTNHLSNKWRAYRTAHNICPIYKLYAAKHTGNTAMAVSGLPAQLQMLHNGHQSLATTQIYIDRNTIDIEQLRTVSEAMEAF
jgi:integrase